VFALHVTLISSESGKYTYEYRLIQTETILTEAGILNADGAL